MTKRRKTSDLFTQAPHPMSKEAIEEMGAAFNEFSTEAAKSIRKMAVLYGANVGDVLMLVESIVCGVMYSLPIKPGAEAKLMAAMRDNVIRRLGAQRLMDGPTKGKG